MTVIHVDKPIKASEIKQAFNSQFPYLKIEFFKKKHAVEAGSLKKDVITDDFVIKTANSNGVIMFGEETLVSELENQFFENLKLSVQIFRKSGKSWLETTLTDNWTLKKQNQEAFELNNI